MNDYQTFATWAQLLDHVSAGYQLFYHAPLDAQPVRVIANTRPDGRLRVYPWWSSDADPFTADNTHLDRFRKIRKVT